MTPMDDTYEFPEPLKKWASLPPSNRPDLREWCRQHDIAVASNAREAIAEKDSEIGHLRVRLEEQIDRNEFLVDELYRAWDLLKGEAPSSGDSGGGTYSRRDAAQRLDVEFRRFLEACQSPKDDDTRWVEILFTLGRLKYLLEDLPDEMGGHWDKGEANRFVIECIRWIEMFIVGDVPPPGYEN